MQMLSKKGAIGIDQLAGIIVIILVAGIMLTVGLRVDDEMQDLIDDVTINTSFTNITTEDVVNASGVQVTGYTEQLYRNCQLSVAYATNETGIPNIVPIHSGNYTVTNCTIIGTQGEQDYINNTWNISGSIVYSSDTNDYNATESIKEGKSNISENMGLLGTIIIFGVIISVVAVAFMISRA